MNDIVTLTVNEVCYQGWKSIRIEVGLERISRSFELAVTEQWPGSIDKVRRVVPGDLVEVSIGSDLVCTGYIDATPIDYDTTGITIMLRGRSKSADLVDSSAEISTGQFKNLTPDAIAKKIAEPYGLLVITEVDTGGVISDFQVQQGESAFESLDRIAKQRQILITDNAQGNVVLAAPASAGNATDALVLGNNILSASAGFDFTEVYSTYKVKGQKTGTDDAFGASASQPVGTAIDSKMTRQRVLIVRQSGQADTQTCQQRANYEQQVRRAKAGEIRYRVAGWRQSNGQLWTCNTTVQIIDSIMQINKELLISEVSYSLDESGLMTELVVIPAKAFTTEPEAKAKAHKKSKKAGNTSWVDQ